MVKGLDVDGESGLKRTMLEQLNRLDVWLRNLRPGSRPFWTACAVPALAMILFLGIRDLPKLWRLAHGGVRVDGDASSRE